MDCVAGPRCSPPSIAPKRIEIRVSLTEEAKELLVDKGYDESTE